METDEENKQKAFSERRWPLQSAVALRKYVNCRLVKLITCPSSLSRCFVNHSSEMGAKEKEFDRENGSRLFSLAHK